MTLLRGRSSLQRMLGLVLLLFLLLLLLLLLATTAVTVAMTLKTQTTSPLVPRSWAMLPCRLWWICRPRKSSS